MKKRKIAIFTTSFLPVVGGSQYELAWLLEGIDKLLSYEKYRYIDFYFIAPTKEALRFCNFENITVKNLNVIVSSRINSVKNILTLRSTLNEIEPDLIHCNSITPDGLMVYLSNLMSFKKRKFMVTSHGIDLVVIPEVNHGERLSLRNKYISNVVLKKVEKLVIPSTALIDFAKDTVLKGNKLKVIPNGVKPTTKKSNDYLVREIREKWQINEEKDMCLLSLSSTREIKNLHCLVDGFAKAKQKVDNLKLLLACAKKLNYTKLMQKVEELGIEEYVKFIEPVHGQVKDAYFKVCDVFCMSSVFENFPISILEAMDYGCTVLTTKVGGITDFVVDRYNGIFVKSNDSDDMAEKIIELYRDKELQKKLVENAKESVKQYYIENIAEQYLQLYNTL